MTPQTSAPADGPAPPPVRRATLFEPLVSEGDRLRTALRQTLPLVAIPVVAGLWLAGMLVALRWAGIAIP